MDENKINCVYITRAYSIEDNENILVLQKRVDRKKKRMKSKKKLETDIKVVASNTSQTALSQWKNEKIKLLSLTS